MAVTYLFSTEFHGKADSSASGLFFETSGGKGTFVNLLRARGPFLESPETLRAIFECHKRVALLAAGGGRIGKPQAVKRT